MTDHDPTPLGAALRERVHGENPDLDHLIRVSTRAGSRLRRRRTIGASVACVAAGVAVVGIVGSALGGSGSTTGADSGTGLGIASQPTAAPSSPAPSELSELSPLTHLSSAGSPSRAPRAEVLPVHVDPSLTGWQIGTAGDDKFPASKGDSFLSVDVRPMDEYAGWSGGDPDRPSTQVVHVGANYFVTVQPGSSVPPRVIAELTDALRYDATWDQKDARRAQ